jgi:hypothetical protein
MLQPCRRSELGSGLFPHQKPQKGISTKHRECAGDQKPMAVGIKRYQLAPSPHKTLQLLNQKGFDTALVGDGAELASAFLSQGLDIPLVVLSHLGQYDPNCEHIVFLPLPPFIAKSKRR